MTTDRELATVGLAIFLGPPILLNLALVITGDFFETSFYRTLSDVFIYTMCK